MHSILRAFLHSLEGLWWTLKHERAVRQEWLAFLIAIPVTYVLPLSLLHKILLLCSILFVIIVELLNTAIEKTVDRISLERHSLAKIAKDTGSAAVLVSIIFCMMIWFAVCFPLFKDYFFKS